MCLAQGHNTVPLVGSNQGPLDSESDALPLRHRATFQSLNLFDIIRNTNQRTNGPENAHLRSEPPRRKTNSVVSNKVWHKPSCTSTEAD